MARRRHPDKDIEAAVRHAEAHGWRVTLGGSHAWGKMYCPFDDADCRCGEFCIAGIWSTPRNPVTHAKQLRRVVDGCVRRRLAEEELDE